MNTKEAAGIILSVNVENALNLFFEPTIVNDNILQNTMGLYKIYTGVKDKMKMMHLDKMRGALQPRTPCDKWDPSIVGKWRTDDLTVCDFEVQAEQCADEFDAGCLANLQGAAEMINSFSGTQALNEIQGAALIRLKEAVIDDVYTVAWFGNKDFDTVNDPWHSNAALSELTLNEWNSLRKLLRHCEGFWAEIIDRTQYTDPNAKIEYLDTNDGTLAGNAVRPSTITSYLTQMRSVSSSTLRKWGKGKPTNKKPVYLLQGNMYQAYLDYLKLTGTEAAHFLIVNGTPIEGMYTYEGYPLMEVDEWDLYDENTGAVGKNARAIFTALENLTIGIDAATSAAYADKSIVVYQSPDPRDKGITIFYAAMRLGFRVAYPKLITAGWNSSTVFLEA